MQREESTGPGHSTPDADFRSTPGLRSDAVRSIAARGNGDVSDMVLALSRRSDVGDDRAYLDWHLFDHLPEQYRLRGIRLGARFVSTPECRNARAVGGDLDDVDQGVMYAVAGVLGAWTWQGRPSSHSRLADTADLVTTVAYLDHRPSEVAIACAGVLAGRWEDGLRVPLLAAPLHTVDPFATARHLPS